MQRISLWPSFTLIVGLAVGLTVGDGILLMVGLIVACVWGAIKVRNQYYADYLTRHVPPPKDGSVDQSEQTAP